MNPPDLSFCFKIDFIEAKQHAPPQSFPNGDYKPPVLPGDYIQRDSTGWCQWTTNDVTEGIEPPPYMDQAYSTSIFYDGASTKRFLFHPADCRSVDISRIEHDAAGDKWGWRKLCFTERQPGHSVLDHDGEYDSLCGRGGSYVPHLLPPCYKSPVNNYPCGLSGKMSLLLALTAFSCPQTHVIYAIKHRLKLRERRWDNVGNWGNGCKCSIAEAWLYTSREMKAFQNGKMEIVVRCCNEQPAETINPICPFLIIKATSAGVLPNAMPTTNENISLFSHLPDRVTTGYKHVSRTNLWSGAFGFTFEQLPAGGA